MNYKLITAIFCVFVLFFSLVSFFVPDRDFSEMENRNLAQLTSPTLQKIFFPKEDEQSFMEEYESYLADQFAGRDAWVTLKSFTENKILGKTVNNGVFICDNLLMRKIDPPSDKVRDSNVSAINSFAKRTGVPCYIMFVPSASEILYEKLPPFAPTWDQTDYIRGIYSSLEGVTAVDITDALLEKRDEYIYYRTDHHWTADGAFIAYNELRRAMGEAPVSADDYKVSEVTHSFNGTLSSDSGAVGIEYDTMKKYETDHSVTLDIFDGQNWVTRDSIYFDEALEIKDKYTYYLGQNNPIVTVRSSAEDGKKILVFKDSYSHCFAQFMTGDYSEITLVDMRYIPAKIDNYVNASDYDEVLFIYSIDVFCHQNDLVKIK